MHRALDVKAGEGMPAYFVDGMFLTPEAAQDAAERVISQEGYRPGEASCEVVEANADDVSG